MAFVNFVVQTGSTPLTADNFTLLAEDIAKRVATYQSGRPTTIIGPPTAGARVLNGFWPDALGGEWRCTGAGTPGTWLQIRPRPTPSPASSTGEGPFGGEGCTCPPILSVATGHSKRHTARARGWPLGVNDTATGMMVGDCLGDPSVR